MRDDLRPSWDPFRADDDDAWQASQAKVCFTPGCSLGGSLFRIKLNGIFWFVMARLFPSHDSWNIRPSQQSTMQ